MRLSDDKIRHITHVALKGLIEKNVIAPPGDEGLVRREMQRVIVQELKLAEELDKKVIKKLESYAKKIYEGSSEWDVMYQKFFEEECSKKGRG
jgi:hypothetical protein